MEQTSLCEVFAARSSKAVGEWYNMQTDIEVCHCL